MTAYTVHCSYRRMETAQVTSLRRTLASSPP